MSMFRNLLVKSKKPSHNLPSEYQEVEWVGSKTGQNNYYDTFSYPNGTTVVEIEISDLQNSGVLFGSYDGAWTSGYGMYCNLGTDFWYHYNSNTQVIYPTPQHFYIKFGNRKLIINDETVATFNAKTFNRSSKLYLFAGKWTNKAYEQPTVYKMHYCKIYKNGVINYELIPCYRKSDGKIGFYNLVSNSFSSGYGTFDKGPDV